MNKVNDFTQLRPRVVSDPLEIDQLRWFQIQRYFERGLLDAVPHELPLDRSVDHSTYFGVYAGDEVQATARIVRDVGGLPMLRYHRLYPDAEAQLDRARGSVAEISRLAVGGCAPHSRNLSLLSREFLRFGLNTPHATLLIASVERPLVRILSRTLGVPLEIIGPSIDQYGSFNGETVPILIDTIECLNTFVRRGSRRWEFFLEDLVIDLDVELVAPAPLAVGAAS